MSSTYQYIQWVVQQNLTNSSDVQALEAACKALNVTYIPIDIVPFSNVLPDFNKSRKSIFYGSTTISSMVVVDPILKEGLFFNPDTFSITNYFSRWGKHMLNYGASVTTFEDFMLQIHPAEQLFFIRPDDDTKSFSGETHRFGDMQEWYDKLKVIENTNLSLRSKIVVARPYHIQYEWRL